MGDQPHRQQGMTTELEEMVLPPDAFNAEQALPDGGQRLFGLAQRGFVGGADKGAVIRGGQGLAVYLAVGCQRDPVQPHVG